MASELELRIRLRERILNAAVATTLDGYWVVDRQRRFRDVNDAYLRLSGYTREEFLALEIGDVEAEESEADTEQRMRSLIAAGSATFRSRHRRKDGSTFPVAVSVTYLADEGGLFVCFCRDLVEATQREERLALQSTMLDVAPMSITVVDHRGRFLYANQFAARTLGYEVHELVGLSLLDHCPPREAELFEDRVRRVVAEGTVRLEVVRRTRDGTDLPFEVTARSVDWHGQPAVLAIGEDLRDRRAAEVERARLQEELFRSRTLESVGRLAGGIAHDFNNMLNVIGGYAQVLLDELEPASPHRDAAVEIQAAANHSADLTRQLLVFARRQPAAPQALDLNRTVGAMIQMLRRLVGDHIELAWQPDEGIACIRMDPAQVHQLVVNLVVNARDAIGEAGGRIVVETGAVALDEAACQVAPGVSPGPYARLTIRDDGCGMDEQTREKIFEPFFTTKPLGQGTGLGLATVYGIVTQNRGLLQVDSAPGAGTAFHLLFPTHPEHTPQAAEVPRRRAGDERGAGELVLVVEDQPKLLHLTIRMLERLGYRALGATTGEEAIALASAHIDTLALLITDVVMPAMTGPQLAARLRERVPALKVLYMSGYRADVLDDSDATPPGAFIAKPFGHADLASRIRAVLAGTDGAAA